MYILEIQPKKNLMTIDCEVIDWAKKRYSLDEIVTKDIEMNSIKKAGLPDGHYLIKDGLYYLIKLVDKTVRGWIYNTYNADVEVLSQFIVLDTSNVKPDRCLYGDLRNYEPCGNQLVDGKCMEHTDITMLTICKGRYIEYFSKNLKRFVKDITLETNKNKQSELAHELFKFVITNKYFVKTQPVFHCGILKKMDQYETEFKMDVLEYRKALTVDL